MEQLSLDAVIEPNPGLVGYRFGDGIVVTGTSSWSPAYLLVDTPHGPSCRATQLVRAHAVASAVKAMQDSAY